MASAKRPRPKSRAPRPSDLDETVPDNWDDDSHDYNAGVGQSTHLHSLAPGARLANIPEIMDMIFLHVEPRTLLVSCQRTCTLWHRIICSNRQLQERLYFIRPVIKGDQDPRVSRPINPLIQESFAPLFTPFPTISIDAVKLNSMELPFWDMRNGQRRHKAFTRSNASWRRMHLMAGIEGEDSARKTDIAFTRKQSLLDAGSDGNRNLWIFQFLDDPEGWRMGDLWDLVFAALFMGTETRWKKFKVTPELQIDLDPRGYLSRHGVPSRARELYSEASKVVGLWVDKVFSDREFWGIDFPEHRNWRKEAWRYRCEDFKLARWNGNGHVI